MEYNVVDHLLYRCWYNYYNIILTEKKIYNIIYLHHCENWMGPINIWKTRSGGEEILGNAAFTAKMIDQCNFQVEEAEPSPEEATPWIV